jgi:membrane protein implicated in regulation of membrane protease activity
VSDAATATSGSKRYLIGGGAAACAVCCAPPVLALVGIAGAGTLATVATFAFAGVVFAVVVAALTVLGFTVRKRRRDPVRRGR